MVHRAYRLLACAAVLIPFVALPGLAYGRPGHTGPGANRPPSGSAGCGHAWQGGVDSSGTLTFGGLQRTYLLHVPPAYSPATLWPLILNLHGLGANAAEEAGLSLMSRTADTMHALVAYPNGTGRPAGWNVGLGVPATRADDVGFLSALVAGLERVLCVDTSRVAATGASDGAVMDYYLACKGVTWLSLIAPVAGYRPMSQARCALAHRTPLIAFNGKSDPLVPYKGAGRLLPPIPDQVHAWAQAQGCHTPGHTGFSRGDVVETVYSPCPGKGEVDLYTITDGGHTWPGGFPVPPFGKTTNVIDASSLILAFVEAYPRRSS